MCSGGVRLTVTGVNPYCDAHRQRLCGGPAVTYKACGSIGTLPIDAAFSSGIPLQAGEAWDGLRLSRRVNMYDPTVALERRVVWQKIV